MLAAPTQACAGYDPVGLGVRIGNAAPPRPAQPLSSAGHGLRGMRERTPVSEYTVTPAQGADAQAYARAAAAIHDLKVDLRGPGNAATTTIVTFSMVFTVLLAVVAALGFFNTVLLTTRERRRDLGMLKAIGMTPRQVTVFAAASVTAVGAAGGLLSIPVGVVAHRLIVDNVGVVAFPESVKDVWHLPQLAGLAVAGDVIAVLGALTPARSAARLTVGGVLHTE